MKEVSIEITHDCGLNCIMCSSNATHPSPIENELTIQEIDLILKNFWELNKPEFFSISGGEPAMHPKIQQILSRAQNYQYKPLFYTCGAVLDDGRLKPLPEDLLDSLKPIGATVIFDVQSLDERTHDKIMDKDGAFASLLSSMQMCQNRKIPIEAHFVPQKDNFKHIIETTGWLSIFPVKKVSFLRLVRQGRATDRYIELDKKQFLDLQYTFLHLLNRTDFGDTEIRLGHPIDWQFLINPKAEINSCRGGMDAPLVQPDGRVDVCPAWKNFDNYRAGNIRQFDIKEIWEGSSTYETFRWFIWRGGYRNIEGKCRECPFLFECKGGCVAQRLLHNVGRADVPLGQAILLGADPMCWWGD